jgi:hypothetical protein
MILSNRFLAATIFTSVAACSQGPSQISRFIGNPKVIYNYKVYALPRGAITISIRSDEKGIVIQSPEVKYYPDVNARFAAEWLEQSYAQDHFTFQIGSDGLLTSTSAINKDETAAIVGRVMEIAAEVAKGTAAFTGDQKKEDPCKKLSATVQIDPFKPGSLEGAQKALSPCYYITITNLDDTIIQPISTDQVARIARECANGVCARLTIPIMITIKGRSADTELIRGQYIVVLPDPNTIAGYDINRGPCIQRQTDFTFSNGMLTKVDLQKESEILGCLAIPLSLAKAVGSIPSSILQARINVVQNETSLVKAQNDYLNAITTLMNNQNNLLRAVAK